MAGTIVTIYMNFTKILVSNEMFCSDRLMFEEMAERHSFFSYLRFIYQTNVVSVY